MCETAARSHGYTEFLDQPSGQRRRAFDCDLLSQNGANRKFKAIPATRHAQTRSECHWLRQQRIGAQLTRDFEWIGVEVKHIPDALDDKEQPTGIREADTNGNRALTFFKKSFDTATECIQGNGPPVTTSFYNLNTRCSPERQKRQHPVPVERASKAEAKQVLVVRLYCRLVREFANVCRGPLVRLANRRIEVTDTSEAGTQPRGGSPRHPRRHLPADSRRSNAVLSKPLRTFPSTQVFLENTPDGTGGRVGSRLPPRPRPKQSSAHSVPWQCTRGKWDGSTPRYSRLR